MPLVDMQYVIVRYSAATVVTDAFKKNSIMMSVKLLNLWEYLSRWNLSKTGGVIYWPKRIRPVEKLKMVVDTSDHCAV